MDTSAFNKAAARGRSTSTSAGSAGHKGAAHADNFFIQAPQINLPKGGGAIRGIDEKFSVNAVNGTAAFKLSLPVSEARGFSPVLEINYNSGSGNGIFGLGWGLSLASIKRKTEKELPQYFDATDSDTYILADAEDLVPEFKKDALDNFVLDADGNFILNEFPSADGNFVVRRYRPRVEGLFARIERWTENATGFIHWRVISKENVTSFYGKDLSSRIADPADPFKIFEWLIQFSYDDKGHCILYEYKQEDKAGINTSQLHNKNRLNGNTDFTNTYLKKVRYGNIAPYKNHGDPLPAQWLFETVFDYGEHDAVTPPFIENTAWSFRPDAFSEYRSGFEIRTCRLCKRVLLYHFFPELPGASALVKAMNFTYSNNGQQGFTFLSELQMTGFTKHDDASYTQKSLPPFSFVYQKHEWNNEVKIIDTENLLHAPAGLDEPQYMFTDLYNEGLSGILTEQAEGWFYKKNLGGGNFTAAKLVTPKPSFNGLQRNLQLLELEADGTKQVVNWDAEPQGFFDLNTEEEFQGFIPFERTPTILLNGPNTKLLDLTGDGRSEVLITEHEVLTWYPSQGKKGYDAARAVVKPQDEEKGPALVFADSTQTIFLADMNGDGLTDIVRVRNGETCYWPNLGYAKFGAKVSMDNAPVFDNPDQFNPAFIRLADIDGSGTTDVIYLGKNQFSVWLNQHGNSFPLQPVVIETFPHINNYSKISVIDLLGNGMSCLVWNSLMPAHQQQPLRYIDLMGSRKPHIMISYSNNLGKEVFLEYKPSTEYYIKDQLAGTPWVSKLPFPIHCVCKSTVFDRIMKTSIASEYSYHHGYYDHREREFCGFGRVDQTDTEIITHFVKQPGLPPVVLQELKAPQVLTKTWYHTGALLEKDKILNQFAHEYFQNLSVPENILPEPELPAGLNVDEWRQAYRACKRILLRKEIYALDGSPEQANPYSAEQHNCLIKLLQNQGNNKHAVFLTHESESINYNYERNPADPRIAHNFVLEIDNYANPLKTANVVYPRQSPAPGNPPNEPEQDAMHITYKENVFTNDIREVLGYRAPLEFSNKSFEITGLAAPVGFFTLQQMQTACAGAAPIDYEAVPGIGVQKRLIEFVRKQYRHNDGVTVLGFGVVQSKALLHQSYKAAFNQAMLTNVFAPKIALATLQPILTNVDKGGYVFADNYFWLASGTQGYDINHFYTATRYTSPFGKTTQVEYDNNYFLFVKKVTDAKGNEMLAKEFNYRTLSPYVMRDMNDNCFAVRLDELGMVIRSFVLGKPGIDNGDELDTTKAEIKNANDQPTGTMEYNLFEWYNQINLPGFDINNYRPNPSFVKTRFRETHFHADPLHQTKWQELYAYSNGGGHEVLTKLQAEAGAALQVNPDGTITPVPDTSPNLRWVGHGRSIFNSKENPVKQYEPYFTTTPSFDDEQEMAQLGHATIFHYDPLERAIRTVLADQTFSKAEFTAWQQVTHDANDTSTTSDWYLSLGSPNPLGPEPVAANTRAAWLSARHDNTPLIIKLDTLGRNFLAVADKGALYLDAGEVAGDNLLSTRVKLDIEGNELEITDPLSRKTMQYQYDMLGNTLKQTSIDAGNRWTITDVAGNPLLSWNDRGFEFSFEYDELRRPARSFVKDAGGITSTYSVIEYGEGLLNDKANNLRGSVHKKFDQSGIATIRSNDFKGNLLSDERQLASNYKTIIDWLNPALIVLEPEIFESNTEYDALSRPIKITAPHSVGTPAININEIYPGYNEAGLLEKLEVKMRGAAARAALVTNINYNAKALREEIFYANGAKTAYTYEAENFRLKRMLTTRNAGATILQDLNYTFDAVGNIVDIADEADEIVKKQIFFGGENVQGRRKFEFDALYRLVSATGRKHAGQTDVNHQHPAFNFRNHPFVNSLNPASDPNDINAFRNYTERYVYDKIGNIKSQQHIANAGWTRTFIYDNGLNANNRLTSTTLGPTFNYTYDAHGNMHGLETLLGEVYDFMDQFREGALGGGGNVYYVYDGEGQRVRKITERQDGTKRERIYLSAIEIYRERNAANVVTLERETLQAMNDLKRVAMIDTPVIVPAGNNETQLIRYQYQDHLSCHSLELDNVGQLISYEEFFPYGTTSFSLVDTLREVPAKRYRYTGKERDEESGLSYHGARYYATWLCRWTQIDPLCLGFETKLIKLGEKKEADAEKNETKKRPYTFLQIAVSPYNYAHNNPVSNVDFDGKQPTPVPLTTTRLRAIARANGIGAGLTGIQFNRAVGIAFESFVLSSMGFIPRNTRSFLSPARGAATGGLPTSVIPEFVRAVTKVTYSWGIWPTVTSYPDSSFFEVKAVGGTLTLSSSRHQIRGLIDVAARSPAGMATGPHRPIPVVTFITTGDTVIGADVIAEATRRGVAIWQAVVFEIDNIGSSNPTLDVGPLVPLNPAVYLPGVPIPTYQTLGTGTLTNPPLPIVPIPVPNDPDPTIVEP